VPSRSQTMMNDLPLGISELSIPSIPSLLIFIRNTDDLYLVKGYAYAGGGRRVAKVEVSLDEGTSWKLADV
jgi:hypothetical protein